MKAIILAAGKGTRISRMVQDIPKCTLPINGRPLISNTVEMLINQGIEICVCVGYMEKKVKEALDGFDVKYYHNPFFDVTNSIASLWFAKNEINDDMLILNADVFFTENILNTILNDNHEVSIAMDTSRTKDGDYFFKTVNGCIEKYGKDLPISQRSCEYVGVIKIKKSFTSTFINQMNILIDKQQHGRWWEEIIYTMSDKTTDIRTVDISGEFWAEIDYFDDYERILNYIENNDKK